MKFLIKNINHIDNTTYHNFFKKLSTSEQKRINNKINETEKKKSLLGLILLEQLLKTNISNIKIKRSKNNKPYIENSNVYFSISHKKDYVITIISHKRIGVDLEYINKEKINNHMLKYFATTKEQQKIINSNNKEQLYFTIFSLKESYLKMKDILFNKNIIEFEINNDKIINFRNDITIKTITYNKKYIITICEENV